VKAWQASDRWGCSHAAPQSCPWCENPDGELWRDVSDYQPIYGLQSAPAPAEPRPALTLAEFVDKHWPGFWERSATR
jgi:hypothetical protein